LSVWKLGVASCNFTTSVGEIGEVGEIGSFEGLAGMETEEVFQLSSVWKLGVCPLLYTPTEKASVSRLVNSFAHQLGKKLEFYNSVE